MSVAFQTPSAMPQVYAHRALILDDNDGNRMILKFAMQMGGLPHEEAATGKAALAAWSPGKFAFAFLDIELPDMNGLDVAWQLRERDSGLSIIMCSTNDDPITISKAIDRGCDMFLVKPFQLDILMKLVKDLDRVKLRKTPQILIIDNTARTRWQARPVILGTS